MKMELTNYLILLVLLKSPILVFIYFKFIHKSNNKKEKTKKVNQGKFSV